MLDRFIGYIEQNHLLPSPSGRGGGGESVLLAVSGGRDSVCMADLFHRAGIPFAIAHCNFNLRPGDCDRDEAFVRRLAERYGVECHVAHFDTRAYAAAHSQSIEEAARHLRYDYFAQLIIQHSSFNIHHSSLLTPVATAHHRDDSIETFFLNLFRGTGIAGLHGIRPVSELRIKNVELRIIRPLLSFSRAEIDAYIEENHLDYVEDHTNAELDARRNQIRHRLMPLLRELYPSVDTTMAANIERLHDTELLYKEYIEQLRSSLITPHSSLLTNLPIEILSIDLPALLSTYSLSLPLTPLHSLIFEIISPYGFNASQVSDILEAKENGKLFHSPTHVAELHQGHLLIAPHPLPPVETAEGPIHSRPLPPVVTPEGPIHSRPLPEGGAPLQRRGGGNTQQGRENTRRGGGVRPWRPGDRIRLKSPSHSATPSLSHSKLVSDYLKDLGLSRIERQYVLVTVDENDQALSIVGLDKILNS